MDLSQVLSDVFGYSSFRPHQESVIRAVLNRRDAFVVMPTGAGKSLCYQLPALARPGLVVVISPLIALMKDQVDGARMFGIRAAAYNSSLTQEDKSVVAVSIRSGELDLLYVAPERIAGGELQQLLAGQSLTLIAIDEAHCVSEWGHDFRPEYLRLGELTSLFPGCPVAAFTATATPRVQEDTIRRLRLRHPLIVRSTFERENLFYRVRPKEQVRKQLLSLVSEHSRNAGIIYRSTRKEVERTAKFLRENGINASAYHAGLDAGLRSRVQEKFNRDEIECIVATIAFGMGIDKPNVRYVIHADLPKGMEQYYQESGRAGRDGDPAVCELLFSASDIQRSRFFISSLGDEHEKRRAERSLKEIVRYAATIGCRKDHILRYFGESPERESCGACDVCADEVAAVESTSDAKTVIGAITGTGSRFGTGHVVKVITGSSEERLRRLRHNSLNVYGTGSDKSAAHWRRVIDEMITQGFVHQSDTEYPVLMLSERCDRIVSGQEEFFVSARKQPRGRGAQAAPKPSHSTNQTSGGYSTSREAHGELFEHLRACRTKISKREGVPAYMVFHDRTLRELAAVQPQNLQQMRRIHGIGAAKLARYGSEFLRALQTAQATTGEA